MKVSKLIHDLHEQVEENKSAIDECVFLRNENEGFLEEIKELKKENTDLKQKQNQDTYLIGDTTDDLNRQITNLRIKQKELEKENKRLYQACHYNEVIKLRKENVRLVAQLENDEHNVGHLDEKMKRLDYLEKVFASNRYVFTDIPNTPENLKMVKMMKKYVNKRRYNLRWRGQYLVEGENWKQYQYGQPLSKSKCIRVYIDSLTHAIDTVEGFNEEEVNVILGGLYKEEDQSEEFITSFEVKGEENAEIDEEKRILNVTKQLINYFQSMRLHLQNSASKPIKDLVNIVIPKGEKNCHTQ
jgi:DNA repair ATPase RecN